MKTKIYDEPTGRLHINDGLALFPDKQRYDFGVDTRVFVMACGMKIVLGGQPKNKPKKLISCEECLKEESNAIS